MEEKRTLENFTIMTVIYNELVDFSYGQKEFSRNALDLAKEIMQKETIEELSDYVKDTITVSLSKYGEISSKLIPHLKNWTWDRIPLLTRAILIMSYARFHFVDYPDKNVVIDIAVELCKTYVEEKQAKFVNAILDCGVLNR